MNDQLILIPDDFDISLVPGPSAIDKEPAYSFDTQPIEVYNPEEFSGAVLDVPGVRLIHPALPAWDDWKARWETGNRFIEEAGIAACEVEPLDRSGIFLAWGGSGLHARCRLADLLGFWAVIRASRPGVWLHDTDCRLWTPRSLAERFT
ncbi:hypothetical protein BH23PLA1_BH23PLA1_08590 [soil metagenome]